MTCALQGRVGRSSLLRWVRRGQESLGKAFRVGQGQAYDLALLDGPLGGLLHGGHREVGQAAALHLRGTLEHGMQFGADAGFRAERWERLMAWGGSPPVTVRQLAGDIQPGSPPG